MSDSWTPDDNASLQAALLRLRAEGAARLDPMRLRQLEAMWARLQGQPPAVQQQIRQRMLRVLPACDQRVREATATPTSRSGPEMGSGLAALVALNRELQARQQPAPTGTLDRLVEPRQELSSVRRFRSVWSRQQTEQQVRSAARRAPEQAGPLNSHHLILQSLDLMQTLSPAYLQRFLSHVEALQSLEPTADKASATTRPARKARAAK